MLLLERWTEPLAESNCYLLGDETSKACAMIDPGGDPDDILSMIREAGFALKAILLTLSLIHI